MDADQPGPPEQKEQSAEYLLYFNQQWVGDHPRSGSAARAAGHGGRERDEGGRVYVFAGGLEEDGPV